LDGIVLFVLDPIMYGGGWRRIWIWGCCGDVGVGGGRKKLDE
jgi:hypothetical protein